jgi:hypothetical protein
MLPTVREGDGLMIRHVGPGDLAVGDLGVFWAGENLLVHRVIGLRLQEGEYQFLLKGDSSLETQCLSERHLLAKVIEIHRGSRIIHLEFGLWPWVNKVLGHFTGWSHKGWLVIKKAEERIAGDQPSSTRPLPSRLFFLSCSLLQRRMISLLYLFRGRD